METMGAFAFGLLLMTPTGLIVGFTFRLFHTNVAWIARNDAPRAVKN